MEVTIIEEQVFDKGVLFYSKERKIYPRSMDELVVGGVGLRANKIRLNLEFEAEDIPKLMEFLNNVKPCFTPK